MEYYESHESLLESERLLRSTEGRARLCQKLPQLDNQTETKYNDLLKFWSSIIIKSCRVVNKENIDRSRFVVDQKELLQNLTYKGATPLSLENIVEIMETKNQIVRQSTFSGLSLVSWITSTLAGLTIGRSVEPFVVVDAIDKELPAILQSLKTYQDDSVLSVSFIKSYEEIANDEIFLKTNKINGLDLDIILKHLENKKMISILDFSKENEDPVKIIKFSADDVAKPILETEIDFVRISRISKELLKESDKRKEETTKLETQMKEMLKNKSKSKALFYLRRKKMYEKSHEELLAKINNIDEILFKICNMKTDAMTLAAYKTGNKTLKEQMLNREEVELACEQVQETLEHCEEIENSMAIDSTFDEDALLQELDALTQEDPTPSKATATATTTTAANPVPKVQPTVDLESFPDVPVTAPVVINEPTSTETKTAELQTA